MPESRRSRGSSEHRGRSRGRGNAAATTYDNMTALNSAHPDPLTRLTDAMLNDTIAAQEQLCMTKDNEAQRAHRVNRYVD